MTWFKASRNFLFKFTNPLASLLPTMLIGIRNGWLARSRVYSLESTAYSRQSTVDSLQPTVDSLQSTVDSLQPTFDSRQSTVNSLQSTVYLFWNALSGAKPTYAIMRWRGFWSIEFQFPTVISYLYTGVFHQEAEKNLFREPRFHLTSNNSVKNTIITAVSCLVESPIVFQQKYFGASKFLGK